jgi:hypothetical protein
VFLFCILTLLGFEFHACWVGALSLEPCPQLDSVVFSKRVSSKQGLSISYMEMFPRNTPILESQTKSEVKPSSVKK